MPDYKIKFIQAIKKLIQPKLNKQEITTPDSNIKDSSHNSKPNKPSATKDHPSGVLVAEGYTGTQTISIKKLEHQAKLHLEKCIKKGQKDYDFSDINWPSNVDGKDSILKAIMNNESLGTQEKIQGIEIAINKAFEYDEISQKYLREYNELLSQNKYPSTDYKFRRLVYKRHCQHSLTSFWTKATCDIAKSSSKIEIMENLKLLIKTQNKSSLCKFLHKNKTIKSTKLDKKIAREKETFSATRPESWLQFHDLPENTKIYASHGGGLMHLQDFILGNKLGYPLHKGGLGIEVHPCTEPGKTWMLNNENEYAHARTGLYFDYPARFSCEIAGQYIDAANNGYEGGLRQEFLQHATNFKLENLETGETIEAKNLQEMQEKIKTNPK